MNGIWQVLVLELFVVVFGFNPLPAQQQSETSRHDNAELLMRVTVLENMIRTMINEKSSTENEIDLLRRKLKSVKEHSERKIFELEQELACMKESVSKAQNIIKDVEKTMIADTVMEQNGVENVISNAKDLSDSKATKKERRLLLPPNQGSTTRSPTNSVAFSVALQQHQENLGIHQVVKFDQVITNVGSGFDPVTSVFRAPIAGLYFFTVVITSHATEDIETQIVKNGNPIVNTYSGDSTTWNQGTQSTVVNLNVGDDVYIHIQDNKGINNGNIRIFGGAWSSFSGFLISQ